MSDKFDRSLKFIIASETVYKKGHYGDLNYAVSTNDPKDRGGLTKFGVDKRSHPEEDIENLTYERAVEIYKEEYWDKGKCEEMPWPLCLVHMDGVVNTGIGQQTKFLQRVCGTKDDGGYGPNTRKAMLTACEEKGAMNVSLEIIALRDAFYHKIVKVNPDNEKFIDGWMNRLKKLKAEIERP